MCMTRWRFVARIVDSSDMRSDGMKKMKFSGDGGLVGLRRKWITVGLTRRFLLSSTNFTCFGFSCLRYCY